MARRFIVGGLVTAFSAPGQVLIRCAASMEDGAAAQERARPRGCETAHLRLLGLARVHEWEGTLEVGRGALINLLYGLGVVLDLQFEPSAMWRCAPNAAEPGSTTAIGSPDDRFWEVVRRQVLTTCMKTHSVSRARTKQAHTAAIDALHHRQPITRQPLLT